MNEAYSELFAHPGTNEPLHYDPVSQTLKSSTAVFPILKGVPVLLPGKTIEGPFDYREHYEKDALAFNYFATTHPVHDEENRRLHQQILQQIPAGAHTILDVGCGGAWLAAALIPKGKQVISMDISTTNPIRATELVASPAHIGLVADAYYLPFRQGKLDCIVASEIIEHVKDPQLFLASLFNALKPGGTLIVTTPYNEIIQQSLCIHCNQLTPHNAHIHSFTKEKIKAIAPAMATRLQTKTFNNKLLVYLQLHLLLRLLPFSLWSVIDGTINKLFARKALRLMLVVRK